MIDTHYADDLTLQTNTPAQAESLLNSLEQEAESFGFYENTNEMGPCQLWVPGLLKYLGGSISSTESDVNIHLVKK